MAVWSRLTGAIAAIGIGGAGAAAVEPVLEVPRQKAWAAEPNRILDLGTLAHLIAQGLLDESAAVDEAKRNGFNENRLKAMVQVGLAGPPVAEALQLWRRGKITEAQVEHALSKAQIEQQYHAPIKELFFERLDPAVIATAIQRTVMSNPGILPNQPSTAGSNVPPMPQVPLDPVTEAKATGIDEERLAALTRIVGLPASPDLAARMHFRKIITEGAFNQAILEGNTRGEWAPFLLEGFRQILTAHDYAELQLRGFFTRDQRLAETDKHGMSHDDSDLLFDVLGRAPNVHRVLLGLRRGAKYPAVYTDVPEPYRAAIQRSNIREAWVDIEYHNRFTYPSGFQIRSEAQKGDLTEAQTEQILLEIGWTPEWAKFFATKWTAAAGGAGDPHVAKAETQLWSTTHRSYIAEEVGDAAATARFDLLKIPAGAQATILELWRSERSLIRERLSLAQLKKAFTGQVVNPATGVAWSRADVTAALLERGYSQADAQTILAEW